MIVLDSEKIIFLLIAFIIFQTVKNIFFRIKVRKYINRKIDWFDQIETSGFQYDKATKTWNRNISNHYGGLSKYDNSADKWEYNEKTKKWEPKDKSRML